MATKKLDAKVEALMENVKAKRAEIESLKKPNWKTSQCVELPDGSKHTLSVINDLTHLAMLRISLKSIHDGLVNTNADLGTEIPLTWKSYQLDDWICDVETRIKFLEVDKKKTKLAALEKKLFALTSEEQRRTMELAEIEAELE